MSINVDSEQLVHFTAAAREFPGRPVCVQTLHRWRLHGVRGTKLETCIIGGMRYTSREAISRFISAMNPPAPVPAISANQRRKQSDAARRELEEFGI